MLEIQTKQLPPDIVVLEITGRITIGRECKQLEWATESLVREKQQKKIIFDFERRDPHRQYGNRDHRHVGRPGEAGRWRAAAGRRQQTHRTGVEDHECR
jgi:hypothetical protein